MDENEDQRGARRNDDQRGARPDPPKKRKLFGGTRSWFKNIFAKPATGNASSAGPDEQRQLPIPEELHQSSSTEEVHQSPLLQDVSPIVANERQHEQGPDEQRQLSPPQELHRPSSTEEREQPSKPAPRRSGRVKAMQPQQPPTAPPVVSQKPALLDEAILSEFDRYVRQAWNPTPIPTDERLERWSDLRLRDLLRLKLPEDLSLEVALERYHILMRIIFEGAPEANLKYVLFSDSRSPNTFVRMDQSRRLGVQVEIERSLEGNLLHQHSPYSLMREPTKSAVADALYSATKRFNMDGEIAPAWAYIADKITNNPREPKQSCASQLAHDADEGAAQTSEAPTSKASSTTGVVETDFSYAFLWRARNLFRVLKREHSHYRAVLMVVEMKQLQVGPEVKISVTPGKAKKQYEQGLSQVIKYLYHAWEKFGTRIGLFVCGPFFARLRVIDDKGTIAVECKPCPNVGQEYSSPGSYFKEFTYLSLPHSLLLPYTENPQLAEQLGVDEDKPLPLLNLEGLRKFEELRTQVFESALDMKVAAALGKRDVPSPTSTSAQGQDSGFPTLCDLSPQDNAAIVKADTRSPIHWYISARRDAKDRINEQDVQKFLQAFKAHVPSSSSSPKNSGSNNPDDGGGDNRGREGDSDEGRKDSRHGRSGGYGGYWGGGGGGGQGGKKATGAKSGGPQAKEKDFQGNFEDDVEENVEEDDEQDFLDKVKSWAPNSADPAFALDSAPCIPPSSRPPSTSGSITFNDDSDEDDEEPWPDYVDTDSLPPSITIKAVLSSTMDQLIDDALKEHRLLSGCTADTSERPSPTRTTRTARTVSSGSTLGTASTTLVDTSSCSDVLRNPLQKRPVEGSLREGQALSE
ncbi:hypothetical protein, variant [Cryptococcus amylolentus CBS 6039]|uniref:Uncharacterized protein n=1 Tax=Cryptococcus amylolentus CBS 6039 TaxID=1295533 RepID=A0A1E3HP01_9TREE|nr:hypothetical protein L202_05705 [Cryptococcus amylolentus CBS 6039]XP_018992556.1 hypothetical protein, variant [Cryptococcus amylolentus CBS 6039]ODN77181.1 hypothetical protein L202_05705 [Cryptococcus amylolentus CBS 6039]ODN77182.1 hypothetical protein, variant [Cryptococcus amylolentus CBS 6039]